MVVLAATHCPTWPLGGGRLWPFRRARFAVDWLPGSCLIQQGWKLHISTVVPDALTLVDPVLPLLRREKVSAKVAGSLDVLGGLNEGWHGPSQIGKFITVYPDCGEQAVALAEMLDGATAGLRGPAVPSDRCLHSGSVVHYRYGPSSTGRYGSPWPDRLGRRDTRRLHGSGPPRHRLSSSQRG